MLTTQAKERSDHMQVIRKEGFGSLERKYLWEDISHLSKSENVQST